MESLSKSDRDFLIRLLRKIPENIAKNDQNAIPRHMDIGNLNAVTEIAKVLERIEAERDVYPDQLPASDRVTIGLLLTVECDRLRKEWMEDRKEQATQLRLVKGLLNKKWLIA